VQQGILSLFGSSSSDRSITQNQIQMIHRHHYMFIRNFVQKSVDWSAWSVSVEGFSVTILEAIRLNPVNTCTSTNEPMRSDPGCATFHVNSASYPQQDGKLVAVCGLWDEGLLWHRTSNCYLAFSLSPFPK